MDQDHAHAMAPIVEHSTRSSTRDQLPTPEPENNGSLYPSTATPDASHGNNDNATNHPNINARASSTTEPSKPPAPLPNTDLTNLSSRSIELVLPAGDSSSNNPPATMRVELSSCLLISNLFQTFHKSLKDQVIEDIVVIFKDSSIDGSTHWEMSNNKPGQKLWERILDLVKKSVEVCPIEARI